MGMSSSYDIRIESLTKRGQVFSQQRRTLVYLEYKLFMIERNNRLDNHLLTPHQQSLPNLYFPAASSAWQGNFAFV